MSFSQINKIVKRLRQGDHDALDTLSPEVRRVFELVLQEIQRDGKSLILEALWGEDFKRKPVSIDQFLDDEYYLGKVGNNVYPYWRKELRIVHDPSREIGEWILRGSIGAGKTFVAVISILYKIHYLLCLKDPQSYYNLAPRSPIVFGLFNIFKYLARDTSYQYLSEWVKLSPFFIEEKRRSLDTGCNCWRCRMERQHAGHADALSTGYISFPNHITVALGSSAIHALGQNIFGGLLDEADMGKNKSISDEDLSQVADMYGQVRARMDSRFIQRGGSNPGFLALVSQIRGKDSFLERHVAKVVSSPNTHVSQFAFWEVKSVKEEIEGETHWINLFEGEPTFKVVVGNQRIRSFIPDSPEQIKPDMEVINVPESLRERFEYSVDGAIRDLAGIPTYGVDLFLTRRDKLFDCYAEATPRDHPFTVDTVELSIDEDISIVDYFDKSKCMYQHDKTTGAWRPRWYNGVDRAVHVDLSLNRDCTGVAMGCIGDIKAVTRFDEHERPYTAKDYTIFLDFAIRIKAVRGSEIDFSRIRQFIFYLHSIGYPVRWVSYDGWQSLDSMQQFKKAGYTTKLLTVDKKPIPYNYLRSTIMEVRLDLYDYQPFTDEVTLLQDRTIQKLKPPIDHPPKGSKDVSDAVCGVVTRLLEEKMSVLDQTQDASLKQRINIMKDPTPEQRLKDPEWVKRGEKTIINPLAAIFDKYKS